MPDFQHLAGGLGEAQPKLNDGRCCRSLGIKYRALATRALELEGGTDEDILAWAHAHGMPRTDEECVMWQHVFSHWWHRFDPERIDQRRLWQQNGPASPDLSAALK